MRCSTVSPTEHELPIETDMQGAVSEYIHADQYIDIIVLLRMDFEAFQRSEYMHAARHRPGAPGMVLIDKPTLNKNTFFSLTSEAETSWRRARGTNPTAAATRCETHVT